MGEERETCGDFWEQRWVAVTKRGECLGSKPSRQPAAEFFTAGLILIWYKKLLNYGCYSAFLHKMQSPGLYEKSFANTTRAKWEKSKVDPKSLCPCLVTRGGIEGGGGKAASRWRNGKIGLYYRTWKRFPFCLELQRWAETLGEGRTKNLKSRKGRNHKLCFYLLSVPLNHVSGAWQHFLLKRKAENQTGVEKDAICINIIILVYVI